MPTVPLAVSFFDRTLSRVAPVPLLNRYFEEDPTNSAGNTALLSRPGTVPFLNIGEGPIRGMYAQPDILSEDLFVVSGTRIYKYDGSVVTELVGELEDAGAVEIAGREGQVFITDGTNLVYYNGVGSFSSGYFDFADVPLVGDTVTIGSQTYTFTDTVANPNDVFDGANAAEAADNLRRAVNALTGTGAGTLFGLNTQPNASVRALESDIANRTQLEAREPGSGGNLIALSAVSTQITPSAATMTGAQDEAVIGIPTPDDIGIISLDVLGDYVLLVQADSQRIYWIRPGETEVRPLDFFSAETLADEARKVRVVGDQAWVFGPRSTEVFYLSGGDPDLPFSRLTGTAFSRGADPETIVVQDNALYLVGTDDVVYSGTGGSLSRIAGPEITERVRTARKEREG